MAQEVYEGVLSGVLAGQFVQNVFHFLFDNTGADEPYPTANDIAKSLCATGAFIDLYLLCLPNDYRATSIRVRRISTGGGPTAIQLAAQMHTSEGGRTGQISSAQVSPLMIWIPSSEQSKVGKTFLPGCSEDDIEEMALSSDLLDAMQTFIDYCDGVITGAFASFQLCVLRRTTMTGDPVEFGRVSPLIATQRRRLRPV